MMGNLMMVHAEEMELLWGNGWNTCHKGYDRNEDGVVAEANELVEKRDDVLAARAPIIVSVTDSRQRGERPVERKNVHGLVTFKICVPIRVVSIEVINEKPRFSFIRW